MTDPGGAAPRAPAPDPARQPASRPAPTWSGAEPPRPAPPGAAGWARALVRGGALAAVFLATFAALVLVGLVDRTGTLRPRVAAWGSRAGLRALGIRLDVAGPPPPDGPLAVVANHASWLDILALGAALRVTFVSKAEVRDWPLLGRMVAAAGTVFIRRDARDARIQSDTIRARLARGDRLLVFPEGTSSDGRRVLPFRTTLFEALRAAPAVLPVTVAWHAPPGAPPAFYGWWGDMDFGRHLLAVLSVPRQGRVTVTRHAPIALADHPDRKALARAAEAAVRSALPWDAAGVPDARGQPLAHPGVFSAR